VSAKTANYVVGAINDRPLAICLQIAGFPQEIKNDCLWQCDFVAKITGRSMSAPT
jgi:hypothetical protein